MIFFMNNNQKLDHDSLETKSKFITPFCMVFGIVAAFNAYIYHFKLQSEVMSIACLICSIIAFSFIKIRKNFDSHYFGANFICSVFFLCICSLSFYSGGIFSNTIWWLGTIPMIAIFLLNAFYGTIWFLLISISFLGFYTLTTQGLLPPNTLLTAAPEKRILISFGFNASLIFGVCLLAELLREHNQKEKDQLKNKSMILNHLASLGKLSSGIAHEINTPLTVIKWRIRKLKKEKLINASDLQLQIQKLEYQLNKIEEVTSLMQKISNRSFEREEVEINLNKLITELLKLFETNIEKHEIWIKNDVSPNIFLKANYNSIFQAFFQIIDNAVEELKLTTNDKKKSILISAENKNNFIHIQIIDNGRGIPKEFQYQIFEPFFTTKNTFESKGLGLSFSLNVFRELGGHIEFERNHLNETVFKIQIPILSNSN